jgi:hypothetical protein
MANFKISVDLAGVMQQAGGIVNAQVLPLVDQAVRAIAQQTMADWMEGVYRAKLWSGEKDEYAKSIQWKSTGDFSALVWSDYKHASEIENGRPARDLKKMLDTSLKARVTKTGTRYLIIPFRHNANSVPSAAKSMLLSTIVGHGKRLSGTGAYSLKTQAPATVRQRKYNWGDRLVGAAIPRNQQGMVRMNTATNAGKKSSAYLTFRVMSEKSKGWIIPAQPGQYIVKKVVDRIQPIAERVLAESVKRTLG